MPITNYVPNSRIAQPGVCTSLTRPSTPYEGQVIWETDTDKTLVWNGSSWVYLSTSTANPVGLELIKTQTVGAGVGSSTMTNVFSSAYDNYKVIFTGGVSNGTGGLGLQLGPSSVSGYNTNYTHVLLWAVVGGASNVVNRDTNSNASYIYYIGAGDTNNNYLSVDILSPFATKRTGFMGGAYIMDSDYGYCFGKHLNATSFTDLTVINMYYVFTGGTISVYGYKK